MAADDLDAEELLHLALSAMEDRRDADALVFLKRGLALEPQDGRWHYLLGAVHAQLGMSSRAVGEFQRAVELAPQLHEARFQLGLLQVSDGDVEAARLSWQPLDALGAEHPLVKFREGMLALAEDRFQDCLASLRRGLEMNTDNDLLGRDMQRVIDSVEALLAGDMSVAEEEDALSAESTQHVLLAGYRPPPATGT